MNDDNNTDFILGHISHPYQKLMLWHIILHHWLSNQQPKGQIDVSLEHVREAFLAHNNEGVGWMSNSVHVIEVFASTSNAAVLRVYYQAGTQWVLLKCNENREESMKERNARHDPLAELWMVWVSRWSCEVCEQYSLAPRACRDAARWLRGCWISFVLWEVAVDSRGFGGRRAETQKVGTEENYVNVWFFFGLLLQLMCREMSESHRNAWLFEGMEWGGP